MYLKFKKEGNFYKVLEFDNEQMHTLADFLTNDVGNSSEVWKKLVMSQKSTSGNACCVYNNNSTIEIEYMWSTPDYEGENAISLPLDQFLFLLDRWNEICLLKPNNIVIHFSNDDLSIQTD
jgi:hypothetical protein